MRGAGRLLAGHDFPRHALGFAAVSAGVFCGEPDVDVHGEREFGRLEVRGVFSAPGVDVPGVDVQGDVVKLRALMQRSMTEGAGVSRSATSLDASARVVSAVRSRLSRLEVDRPTAELANLCDVSGALLIACLLYTSRCV